MPLIVVNKEKTKAHHNMLFHFPSGWNAVQYDDPKSFYWQKFKRIADSKAVDIVAINPERNELWLIEVKDYRAFPKKDTQDIIGLVVQKVRDTLAGIFTAAFHGDGFYKTAIKQQRIRVVFHLEQPTKASKLYPPLIDLANGTIKLQQRIRVIDPHAKLCNMQMNINPWTVTEEKR